MKRILVALVLPLMFITACGDEDEPATASSSTPTAASASPSVDTALKTTCDKLGRTWAVQAEKLVTKLYLALPTKEFTDAMTEATDQMDIEGCEGPAVDAALMGNYEAAVAAAKIVTCDSSDFTVCGEKAGNYWKKNGFPPLLEVRSIVN